MTFSSAERALKLGGGGIDLFGFKEGEELLLRGVAILVFADEVAVTPGRCEVDALGNKAKVGRLEGVVEFDERKAPVFIQRGNERGHDGGLALAVAGGEVVGHEIAERHPATRERRIGHPQRRLRPPLRR